MRYHFYVGGGWLAGSAGDGSGPMDAVRNFVRQQGIDDRSPESCEARFPALMWQPRIVGTLALVGIALQFGPYWLALGAVLWWCALAPRLNPFDALYNRFVASPPGGVRLDPAPGPRRFAQGMAGSFMLGIGLSLLADMKPLAWTLQSLLLAALTALVVGRLCVGSYVYWLLRGRVAFANRTLPWSRAE